MNPRLLKGILFAIIPSLILLALIICLCALAFGADINISGLYSLYSNESLSPGKGLKLSLDTTIYPWASYERTLLRFAGQEMADLDIYGIGAGIEEDGWFAEVGYYMPKSHLRGAYREALYLEINNVVGQGYAAYHGNTFTYDISEGFGVALGKTFEIDRFFISIIYRWLKFQDVIVCHFADTVYYPGAYWETYAYRDMSGVLFLIGGRW